MANSLTNEGQGLALGKGSTGTTYGIVQAATRLKLFTDATQPLKDGTGFTEVSNGNGYTTNGITTLDPTDWTASLNGGDQQVVLDTNGPYQWTASGGQIQNIKGAFITDASDRELAWWERSSAVTLNASDTITADDLTIRLT